MISRIGEKITARLLTSGIIEEGDAEIYAFGVRQLFRTSASIVVTMMLGVILGVFLQSLLFLAAFMPLRQYAGGYHASSPGRCFASSCAATAAALLAVKYLHTGAACTIIIILLSLALIFMKAPVESRNNPLTEKEKTVFRKNARRIAVTEAAVAALLIALSMEIWSRCLLASLLFSAILLLFSDHVNHRKPDVK